MIANFVNALDAKICALGMCLPLNEFSGCRGRAGLRFINPEHLLADHQHV